jgi:hypothetical protein
VLGALAEAPTFFIADRLVLDQLLIYLSAAFAYYLYLAYAEEEVAGGSFGGGCGESAMARCCFRELLLKSCPFEDILASRRVRLKILSRRGPNFQDSHKAEVQYSAFSGHSGA